MPALGERSFIGSQRWKKGDEQVGRENTFHADQGSMVRMVRMFGALQLRN